MTAAAWWAVAVLGVSAMMALLLLLSQPSTTELAIGLAGIGVLVVGWFALGHGRAATEDPSATLIVVMAVATALAVSAAPSLALVQAIVYPMAWVFSRSLRDAVMANFLLGSAVLVGSLVSLGVSPNALVQTALTVVLSLGFSLAMGFWINRMSALGLERGRLLAELQGAQSHIAALHREAGATAEREHLARELHDTIAQDLTGLVMLAQRAQREQGNPETLALIEERARAVLADTRALVAAGAAVGDPGDGLAATLDRLAARFERETGVQVECAMQSDLALSRDVDVVVLRCVQEALGNARKHARASRITIEVSVAPDDAARVRVRVIDDGVGFEPLRAADGFGLTGLTERLALVRGELTVQSAPGAGTTLTAVLPTGTVTA